MPTRISSLISKLAHLPRSFSHKPTVYVRGLLGTTHITGANGSDDDHWMATDFVALRYLIGACDEHSKWLCGTSIRTCRGFLLGDPACDRIVFNPPAFETVVSDQVVEYLCQVKEASSLLSAGDTLVLVLVGHGDDNDHHSFLIDENDGSSFRLKSSHLERCVHGTKGDIVLISTACFSGSWKSPYWTLLAAAGADQDAPSIAASGSKECHGGFFTNALLAEYADEFKIRPPYPGLVDESGWRAAQKEHDFGPTKMIYPSLCLPKRSLQAVLSWINKFRDDIGRAYTSADITFHPCSDKLHNLPFASLLSTRAPFHRLQCSPPSLPDNTSSSCSTAHQAAILNPLSQSTLTPSVIWSASDEVELSGLAADFLQYMPPTITSERGLIIECMNKIYGPNPGSEPFNSARNAKLLFQLKKREHYRQLALAIAEILGWERAIHTIGGPGGEQRQIATGADLQHRAEVNGCLVSTLLISDISVRKKWAGAAGWLARIWEAAGCPVVSPDEWQTAIRSAGINVS